MPREAKRDNVGTKTENGISFTSFACPFMDDEVEKSVTVTVPSTALDFKTFLNSLDSDGLVAVYDRWVSAEIVAAKAAKREAQAADSTVVKRDGKDVDVLSMRSDKGIEDPSNIKLACAVINAAYMQSNAFGWDGVTTGKGTSAPQNAFIVARRKLMEATKVKYTGDGKDYQKMVIPV